MPIDALPPEQQAEARRLLEALRAAADADLEEMACLLASKTDAELLGQTEFHLRDLTHRIGAGALQGALAGRKKGGTKAPPAPAPAAAARPSSSAGRPGGS